MRRDATGEAGPVTQCTLLQLLTCLGAMGLSEDQLPGVLNDVLRSGRVRLVGAPHPWLSDSAAVRHRLH